MSNTNNIAAIAEQLFGNAKSSTGISTPFVYSEDPNKGVTIFNGNTPPGNPQQNQADGLPIDCSSLLQQSLLAAGYNVQYFTTSGLGGKSGSLSAAASQYYTQIPFSQVQVGDIILTSGHVGIVSSLNADGTGTFYGSQTSSGPSFLNFNLNTGRLQYIGPIVMVLRVNDNAYDPAGAAAALAPVLAQRNAALDQLTTERPDLGGIPAQTQAADAQILSNLQASQPGPAVVAPVPSGSGATQVIPLPRPRPTDADDTSASPGTPDWFNDVFKQFNKTELVLPDGEAPSSTTPLTIPVQYSDGGTGTLTVTGVGDNYIYGQIDIRSPTGFLEASLRADASGYSTTTYNNNGNSQQQTIWNPEGQLTQQQTWAADGSSVTTTYDAAGTSDWNQQITARDGSGAITSTEAIYSNGQTATVAYDTKDGITIVTKVDGTGSTIETDNSNDGSATTSRLDANGSQQWSLTQASDGSGSFSTADGTTSTFGAGQLVDSSQDGGTVTLTLAPDSESGATRSLIFDAQTGAITIETDGNPVLTVPVGGQISVGGQSMTAQNTQDGWTTSYTLDASNGLSATAGNGSGITLDLGMGLSADGWGLTGGTWNGTAISASNPIGSLGSIQQSTDTQQSNASDGTTTGALNGDISLINADNPNGLSGDIASLTTMAAYASADAAGNTFMAAWIANESYGPWEAYILRMTDLALFTVVDTAAALATNAAAATLQADLPKFMALPSIIWAQVLGFGNQTNQNFPQDTVDPLVLDLNGQGIDLIPQGQSTARFDLTNSGTPGQVGWVGPNNGILVFDPSGGAITNTQQLFGRDFNGGNFSTAASPGFAALASLAQAGATSFSAATSLIDASTGQLYWNEVKVWIDANGDGVSQPGELYTLADLGITSINLASTSVNTAVGGNVIVASGSYTTDDGKTSTIDDVGLATSSSPPPASDPGPSAAALAFAEIVAAGMPAAAAGQARAAVTTIGGQATSFAAQIAAMAQYQRTRDFYNQGYAEPLYQISSPDVVTDGPQEAGSTLVSGIWIQQNPAPADVAAALNEIGSFTSTAENAAQTIVNGANALSSAQLAAVTANFNPSAATLAAAATAASQANSALGNAINTYIAANQVAVAAGSLVNTAWSDLSVLVPNSNNGSPTLPNGFNYWSPDDADLAAAAFSAIQAGLQTFAADKDALGKAFAALAEVENRATVLLGEAGTATTADGKGDLLIAGLGNETLNIASGDNVVAISSAATGTITVNGFVSGADQLQFLGAGSSVTIGDDGNGGTLIIDGVGGRIDLVGVAPAALNLENDITGVTSASFTGVGTSSTRSIADNQVISDGLVHIRTVFASNAGDTLVGDTTGAVLVGGFGNDTFDIIGSGYTINGGGGTNTVSYAGVGGGVTVNLAAGVDSLGDSLFQIQHVVGSHYADTIIGDGGNDTLDGDGGNDTLIGNGGNDVYVFNKGYGQLRIENGIAGNGAANSGVLSLGGAIQPNDLWFSQSGTNLIIQVLGTSDQITVAGWFQNAWAQLLAIEVPGGLQIGAASVDSLVSAMAAYEAANPGFNPAEAQQLPASISVSSSFSSQPISGGVPVAPNVALDVAHADAIALPAAAATQASQEISTMNGALANLSSVNNSALSWSQQGKPFPTEPATPLEWYVWQPSGAPYPYLDPFYHAGLNGSGPPAGAQVISALTPSTFYFLATTTSSNPSEYPTTTAYVVGSSSAMGSAINDISDAYYLIAPTTSLDQALATAAVAEQAALDAAVADNNANAGFGSTQAATAMADAATAEADFAAAVASYESVAADLPAASALLQSNQALLNSIPLPAIASSETVGKAIITYTTTYSFASSIDQNQFSALQASQNTAESVLASAESQLASDLAIFKDLGNWTVAQIAVAGGSLAADSHGDLLIAGSGGYQQMTGGAGQDTFAFGSWTDTSGAVVYAFQTGVAGDRLLLVPTSSTVYMTDTGNNTYAVYKTGTGAFDTVELAGVALDSLSLYDNLIGFSTADFQNETHSVMIDLASVTPRAADGSAHITTLIGSNYGDTLIGDDRNITITGGSGNNLIEGGGGADALNGGVGGVNTISYAWATSGVTVNLATGSDSTGSTLQNFTNVVGSAYNDTITGISGSTLTGGGGDDTYDYSGSGGVQTIVNGVSTAPYAEGQLDLGTGLSQSNLWFQQVGSDLVVQVLGTTNQVTIRGWFANTYSELQSLVLSNGYNVGTSQVNRLVAAMAAYQAANPSFNPQTATAIPSDPTLLSALNSEWAAIPSVLSVMASGAGISSGSGDLVAGSVVTLTLNLSRAVTVAGGTPTLTLNDGGTATFTGGSGTNALTFSYTVASGQNTPDLAVTAVGLNGATVQDSAGTAANLSGAITKLAGNVGVDTRSQTVIQTDLGTSLTQVGNNYYLDNGGIAAELYQNGSPVTAGAGSFVGWSPIGAVQVAGGFDVAWYNAGAGEYSIWHTDSSGNYLSNPVNPVAGNSTAYESFEPVFQQDLNGDGKIDLPSTVIQTDAGTSLTQIGSYYFIYNGGIAAELYQNGAPVGVGSLAGWSPIGAVQVAGGFDVAWYNASAGEYSIWHTDSSGNYLSNPVNPVAGNSTAFESFEPVFQQDLNGDGVITIPAGQTMELTGSFSGEIVFGGPTGTLKIDHSASFTGTIGGQLAIGDVIDLADITTGSSASLSFSGNYSPGTLTVSDGTHTASLSLLGDYSLGNFTASSDGNGGTSVVDPPIVSADGDAMKKRAASLSQYTASELSTTSSVDDSASFNSDRLGRFGSSGRHSSETTAESLRLDAGVSQLVQAMASYGARNPAFDPATAIQAAGNPSLQNTITASWHG